MTVSRYIHASANDTISFHFYGRVIFHHIYVPHLYPFLCWWTLRLLPCPGCYKHHCNEHWGAWWWKCKLIQPMWRIVWRFLTKLKIQVPYDPAIPLLGICLEKTIVLQDTRQEIFTSTIQRGKKRHPRPHDLSELLPPVNGGVAVYGYQALPLVYCEGHTAPPTPDLSHGVCPCVPGPRRMHQLLP